MNPTPLYTLGLDFGTDSVRALLVDVHTGEETRTAVVAYPRWARGAYCRPERQQYRQHPMDYVESMTTAIRQVTDQLKGHLIGIGVDTTGSTPVAVNEAGTPLALLPEFSENPNACFILWKDHTAIEEAERFNQLARRAAVDYTRYSGGIYSSEWFWAKIAHVCRTDADIHAAAYSWVEHCDWIPYLLSGQQSIAAAKRSRCAAGHKACWHPDWGGLPPDEFLTQVEPRLQGLRMRLYTDTYTADEVAGYLSAEWADRLGIPAGIPIAVGAFDAHMGAVGGQIEPFQLSRIMGTSTCDILVAPAAHLPAAPVRGICGQVAGSVLPDLVGLEAGQSAFGDVYAWLVRLIRGATENFIQQQEWLAATDRDRLCQALETDLLIQLSQRAAALTDDSELLARDWLNGRRTPDADQRLQGVLSGITLGTDAPQLFRALVEATCYGARLIVDRFIAEGVDIQGVIGLGGVAKKSPYVMQTLADVLQRPVKIVRSEQTCALGAAMFAAVAAGHHSTVAVAMERMGSGFDRTYTPDPGRADYYTTRYLRYQELARRMEPYYAADKTKQHEG